MVVRWRAGFAAIDNKSVAGAISEDNQARVRGRVRMARTEAMCYRPMSCGMTMANGEAGESAGKEEEKKKKKKKKREKKAADADEV